MVDVMVMEAEAEGEMFVILEPTGRHLSLAQVVSDGPERVKAVDG